MFDEYEAIITKNPIFLERTKNIGILTPKIGLIMELPDQISEHQE